jgi:hypothetical protein
VSRALRGALVLGFAALTVIFVSDAAGDGRAGGASTATFSSLPAGTVSLPPRARTPASIPGRERVPGFVVVAEKKGRGDYVSVVASARRAKQISDGMGFGDDTSLAGEACFTQGQDSRRGRDGGEAETSWLPNLQQLVVLSTSTQQGQHPTVEAMHSERIVEEGGHVTMETVDAWVDPLTRGVRLIGRATVPLELIASTFGGNRVFAVRDKEVVHVVLVTPRERTRRAREALFAVAGGDVFNSGCDHLRVTLKAEKGQGETASFISVVELPSLVGDPGAAKGKAAAPGVVETTRVRPMHIHASASWAIRDKEPLLSVSAGWDGREREGF